MADSGSILREYTTKVDYPAIYRAEGAPKEIAVAAAFRGFDCADITQPFTFCDLACGPGETIVLLAKCYPHAQFYGVDINPSHIEHAQERANDMGVENLKLMVGDLRDLDPLGLPEMDFVTLLGVLSWIPLTLQREAIKNATKLLKPKGMLVAHYAAAPIAGIGRGGPSVLAMLTPEELHGTVEGAQMAFKRFENLAKAGVGVYPQLQPQVQAIKNSFQLDPEYALHDFFHSATVLSFEDFSGIAEEFGLEFAACSRWGQIVPEAFVAAKLIEPFDFENNWETHQPLLQTLSRETSRVDIFARPEARTSSLNAFTSGAISHLYIENWAENATAALETANRNSPLDLLAPDYRSIIEAVEGSAQNIGSFLKSAGDNDASRNELIKKIAHLLAHRVLNVRLGNDAPLKREAPLTIENFSHADSLWRYLAINRSLPIPSVANGACLTFSTDAKIKLYLMLGGDPNRLLQRVKRMPGFTGMKTQNGVITSGNQLKKLIEPELVNYTNTWMPMFDRYGIA